MESTPKVFLNLVTLPTPSFAETSRVWKPSQRFFVGRTKPTDVRVTFTALPSSFAVTAVPLVSLIVPISSGEDEVDQPRAPRTAIVGFSPS